MTRRGLVLFLSLGLVWGIPYLLIKVAVEEVAPETLVLGRTALAALLLLPVALLRGRVLDVLRRWKVVLAFTVVEIVVPWYFLGSAEQQLPSSTAGLLVASVPLAGVGIAVLMGRPERFTWANWLGLVVGVLGVGTLVGFDLSGSDLSGVAKMAVVVVGYALGPAILARWLSDLRGLDVMAVSLAMAAVISVPVVLLTGGWPSQVPSAPVMWSVVGLAVLCSALAFLLMFALIAEIGPVRSTAITYINPAVAVAAGAVLLSEAITPWTVLGFALVLGGSYLVTRRSGRSAPVPAQADAAQADPALIDASLVDPAQADPAPTGGTQSAPGARGTPPDSEQEPAEARLPA